MNLILLLLAIPLLLTITIAILGYRTWVAYLQAACYTASIILAYLIASEASSLQPGFFLIDSIAVFSLSIVIITSAFLSIYICDYFPNMLAGQRIEKQTVKQIYIFMNLMILSMLTVSMLNNIGLGWIAIEMTTLASAMLLGLYRIGHALEAAWKYLILCSVGIIFALLGIVLFTSSIDNPEGLNLLYLSNLNNLDLVFNADLLKIAFVFIFIGYGTKVGIAPMHTWLPDAYGNSEGPVFPVFSTALSSIVLLTILRFKLIVDKALYLNTLTDNLLIFFGLLTIILAAISLVNQFDYKRMLAYSSMENMGLIVLGLGLATTASYKFAFIQIALHLLLKTSLFFAISNIYLKFQSNKISDVGNLIKITPLNSLALIVGSFALCAMPPFATFANKFLLIQELISLNSGIAITVLLSATIIFGSFIHYYNKMIFCPSPSPYSKDTLNFNSFIAITIPILLIIIISFIFHCDIAALIIEGIK